MINILCISRACSPGFMDYVFRTSAKKPGLSGQKFYRLLGEGFASHADRCRIEMLSAIPITPVSHKRRLWRVPSEQADGLTYHYIPTVNFPVLKNTLVFLFAFIKTLLWILRGGRRDKLVVCDVLPVSAATAALLASKLTGVRTAAIVTDLPHLQLTGSCRGIKRRVRTAFISACVRNYDSYILLTEQMNSVVNPKCRPWMVMEGLVDTHMTAVENRLENKAAERIIMYAGELYEEYGIKNLIEAFIRLKGDDLRLHIYGNGRMAEEMPKYTQFDPRVRYFGMVENRLVVESQLKATLLLNPRKSSEELTKYSFPSKNVESMVSGTPLVTTPLAGMPEEYYPFVYLFSDETVEGLGQTLSELLSKPRQELHDFGRAAREFVLRHKNNRVQTDRILAFIESSLQQPVVIAKSEE